MAITEVVYLGRDNSIDLLLKTDGEVQSLSSITSMKLIFVNGSTITSTNLDDDPIRWGKSGYIEGEVRLFLGEEDLAAGKYNTELVLYDPSNLNGVSWGDLKIIIREDYLSS